MSEKYHVKKDKTLGICNAKPGNCPLGGGEYHFDTREEGQSLIDRINELSSKCNVLEKHCSHEEIFHCKHVIRRIEKLQKEIDFYTNKADKEFRVKINEAKKQKRKNPYKPKFMEKFHKNNPEYALAISKLEAYKKEVNELIEERKQSRAFFDKHNAILVDSSFSKASSSAYGVYSSEDSKKIIEDLRSQGYEVLVRPGIENKEFSLLRFSNHYPKQYLKSGESIDKIWNLVDADILVRYKSTNPVKNVDTLSLVKKEITIK